LQSYDSSHEDCEEITNDIKVDNQPSIAELKKSEGPGVVIDLDPISSQRWS
jgi:hypothetical protein